MLLGAIALLLLAGYYVINNFVSQTNEGNESVNSEREAEYETFIDTETGIKFEYKTSPDGYVVDDISGSVGNEVEEVSVIKAWRVINAQEKIELEQSTVGREGPPTTILVFENTNKQSASMWVDSTPRYSNIGLAIGEVDRDAVVAGANAVRYRTDGLYQSDNIVIANGGYIYHLTGSYLEVNSDIHQDFDTLVDSFEFIPTENNPQAKIDPRVACESALAYMTFPSGEEADAFVEACVAGEHPEVINRYIEDMGMNGAAI